jgi:methionyl-tRNA formyltransferase
MRILFLTKPDDIRSEKAVEFLKRSADVQVRSGPWGSPLPLAAKNWTGDILISYLSRWIVPQAVLANSGLAINFHPAPPERPGIGGTNWALYESDKHFGVTCHLMAPQVDSGPILAVRRFSIYEDDDVASLSERAWENMLQLFYSVAGKLLAGHTLTPLEVKWSGMKHTRAELNALATLSLGMDEAEALRRIKATSYKEFPPELAIGKLRYQLTYLVP